MYKLKIKTKIEYLYDLTEWTSKSLSLKLSTIHSGFKEFKSNETSSLEEISELLFDL